MSPRHRCPASNGRDYRSGKPRASALADVWSRASEYLDFRSYALCGLSDLGYLDHLLDDFAPVLRVLSGYGAKTGLVCLLATAQQVASARRRRTARSQGAAGDEEKADDDETLSAFTLVDVRTRAYDFVARLLRDSLVWLKVFMDNTNNGENKHNTTLPPSCCCCCCCYCYYCCCECVCMLVCVRVLRVG